MAFDDVSGIGGATCNPSKSAFIQLSDATTNIRSFLALRTRGFGDDISTMPLNIVPF